MLIWRVIFYAIFGVPIIFWTFYKSVYDFGPEHIPHRSLFEIIKQPVPENCCFDKTKIKWRPWAGCKISRNVFNARPMCKNIARNKKFQNRQDYKERNWEFNL